MSAEEISPAVLVRDWYLFKELTSLYSKSFIWALILQFMVTWMSSRKGRRLEMEVFAGSGLRYTYPLMALIFSNVVL